MSSCGSHNYSSESLQDRLSWNIDAPITWDAASSSEPLVDQVRASSAFALASVTSEVPGLLAERGAVRAQARSVEPGAGRVLLAEPEAAQGQVQSVGQVQLADRVRMEVS
jgi:hypothetical protein